MTEDPDDEGSGYNLPAKILFVLSMGLILAAVIVLRVLRLTN